MSAGKKSPKGPTDEFYDCKEVQKHVLVLLFIHIVKTTQLQPFKGMQSCKLGM